MLVAESFSTYSDNDFLLFHRVSESTGNERLVRVIYKRKRKKKTDSRFYCTRTSAAQMPKHNREKLGLGLGLRPRLEEFFKKVDGKEI